MIQELRLERPIVEGDAGPAVRRVQEWLTLGRIGVVIDGAFGPATAAAVRTFQVSRKLPANGAVDSRTFERLVAPIASATAPIAPSRSFGADVVRCGEQHLAQHPREIGGANRGPWVRLYMDGAEGLDCAWCAGFVRFVLRQAAGARPLPFAPSASCDEVGQHAEKAGLLRRGAGTVPADVGPGSLFLVRRPGATGWHHTGIVVSVSARSIVTIEGNTNDDGSREGYEAIRRVRGVGTLDYVAIPG